MLNQHVHKNSKLTKNQYLLIEDMYVNKKLTLEKIALVFKVSLVTIRNVLKRQNVPIRKTGLPHKIFSESDVKKIIELYKNKNSQESIAKIFSTSQTKISTILKLNSIYCGARRGSDNGNWRGGKTYRNNYAFIRVYDDFPYKSMIGTYGYVSEHRYNMAMHLKRALEKTETVHHIDGNTLNNSIENLQLRQGKHGKHQVFVCCDCGSKNVKSTKL